MLSLLDSTHVQVEGMDDVDIQEADVAADILGAYLRYVVPKPGWVDQSVSVDADLCFAQH